MRRFWRALNAALADDVVSEWVTLVCMVGFVLVIAVLAGAFQ